MKNLLVVAFHFPPSKSINGGLRVSRFVKYLPTFGWRPHVVCCRTLPADNKEVFEFVSRLPSLTPWYHPYNLFPLGWIPALFFSVRRQLKSGDFSAVLVTCPPFPIAIPTILLSRYYGVPCVLDCRDPWSLPLTPPVSRMSAFLRATLVPFFDRWLLALASEVIVVTPSMVSAYKRKFPGVSQKLSFIPNGFDGAELAAYQRRRDRIRSIVQFVHCGSLTESGRRPEVLLRAFSIALRQDGNIAFRIVGEVPNSIPLEFDASDPRIKVTGRVERNEAIQELIESDVSVIFSADPTGVISPISLKTYESLFYNLPVLLVAPPGDISDVAKLYATKVVHPQDRDPETIASGILELAQYVRSNPDNRGGANIEFLEKFSSEAQTRTLASLLDRVIAKTAR